MPHDRNGHLLTNGDVVSLRGTVDLISVDPRRCNLRLKVADPDEPDGFKFFHADSCLVELVALAIGERSPSEEAELAASA